jgi:hypothetical protein
MACCCILSGGLAAFFCFLLRVSFCLFGVLVFFSRSLGSGAFFSRTAVRSPQDKKKEKRNTNASDKKKQKKQKKAKYLFSGPFLFILRCSHLTLF